MAETTSARPTQGGDQAQQEPNSAKAPRVEAEREENPVQEARRAGDQDSKKQTQKKAHAAQPEIPEDLRLSWEVLAPMAGGICLTKS